jgi:hypothetical protein
MANPIFDIASRPQRHAAVPLPAASRGQTLELMTLMAVI